MQRSRQQRSSDVPTVPMMKRRGARGASPVDEAMLAAQRLAGNAAVGALFGADATRRARADGPRVLPELDAAPRLAVRIPVDITSVLAAEDRPLAARGRRPQALRLEWTGGSGDRSIEPARLTTAGRTTRLMGSLQGFRPLDWAVPVSGCAGVLTPDVTCKVRVGRVDLARAGSEASVTVAGDVVSLAIDFAGGQVRLIGTLTEQGEAPAQWHAEVELDHRRCARLLAPRRGRRAGHASVGATADEPPPADRRDGGSAGRDGANDSRMRTEMPGPGRRGGPDTK